MNTISRSFVGDRIVKSSIIMMNLKIKKVGIQNEDNHKSNMHIHREG